MSLTPSSVRIPARDSGPAMRTYTDSLGKEIQAVVLADADGNPGNAVAIADGANLDAFYNTAGTISGSPTLSLASGYCVSSAATKSAMGRSVSTRYPITLNAAGAVRADGTLSLIATGIGASSAMRCALNWREIR